MAKPLVVLGMHRSGTSFLVRALNLGGLWLGGESELFTVEGRALLGNPKGTYESNECIAINNTMLARSGGDAMNPPPQIRSTAEDIQRIRAFCSTLERTRPHEFPRWGWKDPRSVLTLEAWRPALPQSPFIVASFRHPSVVARSLMARDKTPETKGWALWAHYNACLVRHLERLPHILIRFDVDAESLLEQTVRACKLCGLRTCAADIASWYDASLIRSRADSHALPMSAQIEPLWKRLLQLHRASLSNSLFD
jgi:hypothetical protein